MVQSQKKISGDNERLFQRLRRLQVNEGMTWRQVAEALGTSVPMIMAIKGGRRRFSEKALHRLEMVEHEIAKRKSQAERIVDGLLAGERTAAQLVERELRDETKISRHVEYSRPRAAKALPKEVMLLKPPEERCARLRQLFAQTMDVTVVVLACLPENLRSEKFLAKLTTDGRIRLNNAALSLVIPDWRSLAAEGAKSSR
jgi:transcriptional regulator with XRE-family HTH domain